MYKTEPLPDTAIPAPELEQLQDLVLIEGEPILWPLGLEVEGMPERATETTRKPVKPSKSAPRVSGSVSVTMRVPGWLLAEFKDKAEAEGLGYQTLVLQTMKQAAHSWRNVNPSCKFNVQSENPQRWGVSRTQIEAIPIKQMEAARRVNVR